MQAGTEDLEVDCQENIPMTQFSESAHWLALAYASGLKLTRVKSIVTAWCLEGQRSLAELFGLPSTNLAGVLGLSAEEAERVIAASSYLPQQATRLAQLKSHGVQLVTRADLRYPRALTRSLSPAMQPLLFFCRGDVGILSRPSAAVIGARDANAETIGLARDLAVLLAEEGVVVISGLGQGVGQAAFSGALSAEGQAVAVLPMGINTFSGVSDALEGLAPAVEGGQALLLSPFHPDAKFTETQAIARNKLIIGLADAVFVIAAGEDGMTRETADEALRMGKTVYAWDVEPAFDPVAAGNQALIREGALVIAGVPDILEAVETVVVNALELAEETETTSVALPSPAPKVRETEEAYDPQAILDLLSEAGRVPEALSKRLRGD
jgi:DNA processing protein